MRRSEVYTVRELRKALEGVPDDLPVIIEDELRGVAVFASYDEETNTFAIETLDEKLEEEDDSMHDPDEAFEAERDDMVIWG